MKEELIYLVEYYIDYEGSYFRGAYRKLEDAKKRLKRLSQEDLSEFEISEDGMSSRSDIEGYIIKTTFLY